jgi:carboxypeptidase T
MLLARIRGTREQLRTLGSWGLRLHRTGARKVSDTEFEVLGVLEEPQVGLLELWGYEVVIQSDVKELLSQRLKPVRGNAQPFNTSAELFASVVTNDGYMEVDYIENWTQSLALLFPSLCSILKGPNQTWEGRTVSAVRLRAGDDPDLPSILFTSGVHAAELGGPDSCIYFIYRLIDAYLTKSSLALGNKTFSADRIQAMLNNLDIFVLPCANPDGRAYVQTSQEWWRKNRNPNVGMNAIGVDINRNYDFLWSSGVGSSFIPADDTYKGEEAFSEPETRNIQWLLDTSSADYFMDIHGPSGLLVYTWGDASDQSQDPNMNFLNPAWDGKRVPPYEEYMNLEDSLSVRQLADTIIAAVNLVGNGGYTAQQSFTGLYPTTSTSDDYAFSRHLANPDQHKTYSYTFEYGGADFFPPYDTMLGIVDEVNAAMLELCDAVAGLSSKTDVH